MSLNTPTTAEINATIISQIDTAISQTTSLLPKSFTRVLAKVLAGVVIILYKYCGFIFLQMFVSTASNSPTVINGKTVTPLVEWGRLVGAGDPIASTNAELLIDINVENQVGSLPSGSQLVNSATGVTYITIGAVLLDAAVVQATVRAVNDQAGGGGAGTIGNMQPGDTMSFVNPLANVARVVTVDSQIVTAADGETTSEYRQRVVDRFQKRPQGGALADYELWGEEVAGIEAIYPYAGTNPGEVDVFVESSTEVDGIPTTAQLTAVYDAIQLDTAGLAFHRPVGALVNTLPITRVSFNVEITGLNVDNPATVQADITAALTAYMLEREPYITGVSIPPAKNVISQNSVNSIVFAVVDGASGTYTSLTVEKDAAPITSYTLAAGEKAKIGTVSFV